MPSATGIARGGKTIYGVSLGILMLEAKFPRILGDMGNAETWPFPVMYHVVRGASPEKVVLGRPRELLPDFIEGARNLIHRGAEAITTNCGFLALFQKELSNTLNVPVVTSALMQVSWLQAALPPGKQVGIVTVSAQTLTNDHLYAAGVPLSTPVVGTDESKEFFPVIIKAAREELDIDLARQDVVEASLGLVNQHANIGAIVLECTNMAPYAAAVAHATGLPVYDIYSLITWFHAGLRPRRF